MNQLMVSCYLLPPMGVSTSALPTFFPSPGLGTHSAFPLKTGVKKGSIKLQSFGQKLSSSNYFFRASFIRGESILNPDDPELEGS